MDCPPIGLIIVKTVCNVNLVYNKWGLWENLKLRPTLACIARLHSVEHQIIIIGDALVTSDCFLKK